MITLFHDAIYFLCFVAIYIVVFGVQELTKSINLPGFFERLVKKYETV